MNVNPIVSLLISSCNKSNNKFMEYTGGNPASCDHYFSSTCPEINQIHQERNIFHWEKWENRGSKTLCAPPLITPVLKLPQNVLCSPISMANTFSAPPPPHSCKDKTLLPHPLPSCSPPLPFLVFSDHSLITTIHCPVWLFKSSYLSSRYILPLLIYLQCNYWKPEQGIWFGCYWRSKRAWYTILHNHFKDSYLWL